MRIPSASLSLVSIGAAALLITILVSQSPPMVRNERVEPEHLEKYEDAALKSSSIDNDLKTEIGDLDLLQGESIRSLIGVSIEWTKWPTPGDDPSNHKFNAAVSDSNYEELLRLANEEHHAEAARVLHFKQYDCQHAPLTPEEHENRKDALVQSRIAGYSLASGAQVVSDEELGLYLDMWQKTFDMCSVLRPLLDGDDTDYQKLAADNGSPGAMMDYGNNILASDPDLARSYFYMAWEAGASTALKWLSNYERERFELGEDPSADVDSVALFAAYAAVEEAKMERYGFDPSHPAAQVSAETGSEARARLSSLVPYKRDLALVRARELIDRNGRCCFWP